MKRHDEIDFQRELLVAASGWDRVGLIWRQQSGLLFTVDGRPVRIGFPGLADVGGIARSGRAIQLELKTLNGGVTKEQFAWLEAVKKTGGIAGVVRSIDEARRLIEEEDDRETPSLR